MACPGPPKDGAAGTGAMAPPAAPVLLNISPRGSTGNMRDPGGGASRTPSVSSQGSGHAKPKCPERQATGGFRRVSGTLRSGSLDLSPARSTAASRSTVASKWRQGSKSRVNSMAGYFQQEFECNEAAAANDQNQFHHWLVDSKAFTAVVYSLILLNSIQLGTCTRTRGDGVDFGDTWSETCAVFDKVFLGIFIAEAMLKIFVHRLQYFKSSWNWMDLVVIVVGIVELGMSNGLNLTPFRVLRVLRVFRLLRLLRLFRDLWVVVEGLFASLRATIWICLLLAIELYIFSIVCVDTIGSADENVYPGFTVDKEEILKSSMLRSFNNYVYFGSIPRSMYTLFNVVIGAEWPEIGRPIWEQQPHIFVCFAFFIICTMFGLMNVLIGIIVDNTKSAQDRLMAETDAKAREAKKKSIQTLCEFVFNLDKDRDGSVTMEDICAGMATKDLKELLEMVSLPHGFAAEDLFHLFNLNGGVTITVDEFVTQAYRLIHGTQFQHHCQMLASVNSLKAGIGVLLEHQEEMSRKQDEMQKELRSVQREVLAISTARFGNAVGGREGTQGPADAGPARPSQHEQRRQRQQQQQQQQQQQLPQLPQQQQLQQLQQQLQTKQRQQRPQQRQHAGQRPEEQRPGQELKDRGRGPYAPPRQQCRLEDAGQRRETDDSSTFGSARTTLAEQSPERYPPPATAGRPVLCAARDPCELHPSPAVECLLDVADSPLRSLAAMPAIMKQPDDAPPLLPNMCEAAGNASGPDVPRAW